MSDNKIVMRSKAIISIVAFLAAFGVSVAVTPRSLQPTFVKTAPEKRCFGSAHTARKITGLLVQDIANGRARDRKIKEFRETELAPRSQKAFAEYARAIEEYASASAAINDAGLPGDFRRAWREHMRAWREHAEFLETVNDSPTKFSRDVYYQEFRRQDAAISETWFEVLRIAAEQHDAPIPPGAF